MHVLLLYVVWEMSSSPYPEESCPVRTAVVILLCTCVYVCMYVCILLCACVCMYVCMYVCVIDITSIFLYIDIMHIYVSMYPCICI